MARGPSPSAARLRLACAALLLVSACTAAPGSTPTVSPTSSAPAIPTARATPTQAATGSPGPFQTFPAGCPQQASGQATNSRVAIANLDTASYAQYDVLLFDFDKGLPEYTVSSANPPFTADPSGLPITVNGTAFFSIVLHRASILDVNLQPVYEGPTELEPNLTRIQHVVMAGDFEAVSSWIVGLRGPGCVAAKAVSGSRLVIAFFNGSAS